MKKLAVYIHNPIEFLNETSCDCGLSILDADTFDRWEEAGINHDRILVQYIDIDLEAVPRDVVTKMAVEGIDKREAEIRAAAEKEINDLERRKAELLAIPFIGD
jgi:hypothetical protein